MRNAWNSTVINSDQNCFNCVCVMKIMLPVRSIAYNYCAYECDFIFFIKKGYGNSVLNRGGSAGKLRTMEKPLIFVKRRICNTSNEAIRREDLL